jgi:hypothetical protein
MHFDPPDWFSARWALARELIARTRSPEMTATDPFVWRYFQAITRIISPQGPEK